MAASFESLVVHDAPEEQLCELVEAVVTQLQDRDRWVVVTRDLPHSVVLKVSLNFWSWGEHVRLGVEERSIRISSECRFPFQVIDWGKNRKNVEAVRQRIHEAISAATTS